MIWNTKEWPIQWTRSLVIPIPKKGDSRKYLNYRIIWTDISLINHASKILLKILLNRLNPQAEKIISEEQEGFRKGRSTVEQITNCRIIMEKHIEIQKDLFNNFIDLKKVFVRVWHQGLWQVMENVDISDGITQLIKSLYKSSTSAILLDNIKGYFKTSVGVR